MAKNYNYDHYKSVGEPATKVGFKKKRPKSVAVVDEDNCTGCQVSIPFCPVDCIDMLPIKKPFTTGHGIWPFRSKPLRNPVHHEVR